MMSKMFMLALLCLVGAANAAVYDAIVAFKLRDENVECTPAEEEQIDAMIAAAFSEAGVTEAGNSGNWKVSDRDAFKKKDKKAITQVEDPFNRRLGCGDTYVEYMCLKTGAAYWCTRCACCGGRRRLRFDDSLSVEEAEEVSKPLVDSIAKRENVGCLADDLQTIVKLVKY